MSKKIRFALAVAIFGCFVTGLPPFITFTEAPAIYQLVLASAGLWGGFLILVLDSKSRYVLTGLFIFLGGVMSHTMLGFDLVYGEKFSIKHLLPLIFCAAVGIAINVLINTPEGEKKDCV